MAMQTAIKRSRDHSEEFDGPTAKIAKQLKSLGLGRPDADYDMSGVEARDFSHVTVEDMLETAAEIEIDDRFLKIPRQLSQPNPRTKPTSTALIPYEKSPPRNEDRME